MPRAQDAQERTVSKTPARAPCPHAPHCDALFLRTAHHLTTEWHSPLFQSSYRQQCCGRAKVRGADRSTNAEQRPRTWLDELLPDSGLFATSSFCTSVLFPMSDLRRLVARQQQRLQTRSRFHAVRRPSVITAKPVRTARFNGL